MTPARISSHVERWVTALPTSKVTARACAPRSHGSTRVWPCRSIRRALCGPTIASVMAKAPATDPATAKEPVSPRISQTTPRLVIAIPMRTGAAAAKKAIAPGTASVRLKELAGGRRLASGRRALLPRRVPDPTLVPLAARRGSPGRYPRPTGRRPRRHGIIKRSGVRPHRRADAHVLDVPRINPSRIRSDPAPQPIRASRANCLMALSVSGGANSRCVSVLMACKRTRVREPVSRLIRFRTA